MLRGPSTQKKTTTTTKKNSSVGECVGWATTLKWMGCHIGSLVPLSHWWHSTQGNGLQYCGDRGSEPWEPRMLMSRVICAHLSLLLMLRFPWCYTIFTESYFSLTSPLGPRWLHNERLEGMEDFCRGQHTLQSMMANRRFRPRGNFAFCKISCDYCRRATEGRRDLPLKWKQVKNWKKAHVQFRVHAKHLSFQRYRREKSHKIRHCEKCSK